MTREVLYITEDCKSAKGPRRSQENLRLPCGVAFKFTGPSARRTEERRRPDDAVRSRLSRLDCEAGRRDKSR